MTDALNNKTHLAGSSLTGIRWTFNRPTDDTTTDYTDCAIAFKVFELDNKNVPLSTTPVLTLAIDSGLSRITNTASLQSGVMTITTLQIAALLGTAKIKHFSYVWSITPSGAESIRAFLGSGYDGRFAIAQEGYGGTIFK